MTRIPLRALALAGALLSAMPVAAASHWTYDSGSEWAYPGGSACYTNALGATVDPACIVAYLCTGGAPPQAVDLALYCANRAAGKADDVALWLPVFAWSYVDSAAALAEDQPASVNRLTAAERGQVNTVLCTQVWSFFCANPIALPEHVPLADPLGPFPLA